MRGAWLATVFLLMPAAAHADDRSEEDDVGVHLEGPRESTLERLDGSEWVRECVAPCDLRVRRNGPWRVAGRDIQESAPFTLAAPAGGDETIDVRGGSVARSTTGAIIFLTGLVSAPGGLLMIGVADANNDCDRGGPVFGDPTPCHSYAGLRDAGIAVGISGLVSVLVGAILYATSMRSEAIQTIARIAPSRVRFFPLPTLGARGERSPALALPTAAAQPLLSFTF